MSSFTIAAISVLPTFATRNTGGNVAPPGLALITWSPPGAQYIDGAGSTEPVTFSLPNPGRPLSAPFPIHVAGICTVPKELAGQRFQVIGCLFIGGNPFPVFRNAATTNVISVGGITPVAASNFTIEPSFLTLPDYPIPFRVFGDFQWRVIIASQPDVVALPLTRLEFAFTRTAAPSGPTEIADPTAKTMVNLNGIYPIKVLRSYLPDVSELHQPDYQTNPVAWYLARLTNGVWGWGNSSTAGRPKYDALRGASFLGLGTRGGNINFDAWISGTVNQCNCYDLAALIQLGCSILTNNGTVGIYEMCDSRWVFQEPTGYVLPCVLYGWGRVGTSPPDYPTGLNNPFFLNFPQPYPYIGSVALNTRIPFGRHAWVEAYAEPILPLATRKVIDCTTATWDVAFPVPRPDYATRTRLNYLIRHIDEAADPTPTKTRTGNAQDWIQEVNNTAWMVRNVDPVKKYRIGVWNISATPLPPYLRCLLSGSLPQSLMDEINAVIEKVSLPQGPGSMRFSDAALNRQSIARILSEVDPTLSIHQSSVHVTDESSLLEVIIDGARITEALSGRINLSIHTFNDDSLALATLIHVLSGYTVSPLVDFFERTQTQLGHISMVDKTHTALYFLRGNHFVSVRFSPDHEKQAFSITGPAQSESDHVTAIAELVHTHLVSLEVTPNDHLTPHLRFQEHQDDSSDPEMPLYKTVRVGDVFKLSVTTSDPNENGDDFAILRGETENGAVVICTSKIQEIGQGGMMNVMEFFAVAEGETEVFVYAGHRDTLAPGSVTCKIKVLLADTLE